MLQENLHSSGRIHKKKKNPKYIQPLLGQGYTNNSRTGKGNRWESNRNEK